MWLDTFVIRNGAGSLWNAYPPLAQHAYHLAWRQPLRLPEAMAFCEQNNVDYIFGLSGKKPLARKLDQVCDAVRTERALANKPVLRGFAETTHRAGSWDRERRVVARIEATEQGLDIAMS